MAINGGEVEIVIKGDVAPLRRSLEEGAEAIDELGSHVEDLESQVGDSKGIQQWQKKTSESFKKFAEDSTDAFIKASDASSDFASQIQQIGTSLKNISFAALTTGLTLATKKLIGMAKAGIQDTSALEDIQIQMIGLTHSIEAGNAAMSMAVKYYKNNPFNRFEVTNATKSLIQFGAELKQVPELLDQMGKVSLSTGAKIDTVAYYYQKLISDGRINTLDLIQMGNQNIPIIGALAERLQTTAGGIRELAAQGKISIEDFQEAFKTLADDDAMERFEKTFSRQVDRFKGRVSDMKGALAGYYTTEQEGLVILENGLYSSARNFLKKFADTMTSTGESANPIGVSVIEGFQKVGTAIGKIIDQITKLIEPALNLLGKFLNFIGDNSELVTPLLLGLAVAIGKVGSQLPVIGQFIAPITQNLGNITSGIKGLISTHPMLSALVALFGTGLIQAYRESDEFRQTIKDLLKSLGDFGKSLMNIVKTVLPALAKVFQALISSGAVRGIIQGVANALNGLASALASIPEGTLAGIISFLVSLKMFNSSPIMYAVYAISLLVAQIQELSKSGNIFDEIREGLSKVFSAIGDTFRKIVEWFGNIPDRLKTVGHNMMTGLMNGLIDGSRKIKQFMQDLGNTIVNTLKNVLQIHSPSKAMEYIGRYVTLGLANGIEDNEDAVQIAIDNLASDILKLSDKIIGNQVDFGILDVKGEYQQWKKVSQLFTQGSEQYNNAISKMEDARKSANLKIVSLQNDYNEKLDESIDRIRRFYGLFDDVNLKAGKNASSILKTLDEQVASTQEWASAQKMIKDLGLDEALVEELQDMGVASVSELSAIANMTSDELSTLNDLWLKKQSIANDAGVEQMAKLKDDTLKEIRSLKDGIEGETVDVQDVGGRLVSSISEGITGAMPTLESAFAQLDDYIAQAQRKLGVGASTNDGGSEKDYSFDVSGNDDILKGIEGNLSKIGEMLPQMLIGTVGAAVVAKAAPKLLKWISGKLFNRGGVVTDGIGSLLGGLATNGKQGATQAFVAFLDEIWANTDDPALQDTILKWIGIVNKKEISAVQESLAPLFDIYDTANLDKLKPNSKEYWDAIANASEKSRKASEKGYASISKTANRMKSSTAKTAAQLKGATEPTKVMTESTQTISQNVATSGKSISKASGWLDTIKQGAQTVIWIAGAIAAMAGALWLTSKAFEEIDIPRLNSALIEIGIVIGAFGFIFSKISNLSLDAVDLLLVIGVAVDIAALALACRAAYELMKEIDFVNFQLVLVEMIEALAVFGGASALIGLFSPIVGPGILLIIGVAADIALIGLACASAYDSMKHIEFERFQFVILEMIEALGAFGGLSAVMGIFSGLIALGWVSAIAVCDELVRVSNALLHVYQTVPEDIANVKNKIVLIKNTLMFISETDFRHFLDAIATAIDVGPLTATMNMYEEVGGILSRIAEITIDKEKVENNLEYIKLTLEGIRAKTDALSGWLQAWADGANASSVESAGKIVITYGNVVDALNKLSDFEIDKGIQTGINSVASVIQYILQRTRSSTDILTQLFGGGMEGYAKDIEKIASIAEHFLKMVPTVNELNASENQISDSTADAVKTNVGNIEKIVRAIGEVDTVGYIDTKENDVKKIQSIVNNFIEMVPTFQRLNTMDTDFGEYKFGEGYTKAYKAIDNIKKIVLAIGQVDTGGWIEQKENDVRLIQSILNKFTELAQTTHLLDEERNQISENASTWVTNIRKLVWEIGQINISESGQMDSKIEVIEKSKTIAQKLIEFNDILNSIQSSDKSGIIQSLLAGLNDLIGGVENQLTERAGNFENVGAQLGQSLITGISSKSGDITSTGESLQGALWRGIENRMNDEYYQGRSLGERFRQGLYDIDYANAGWWAVQGFINGAWSRADGSDGVYNAGWWIADKFLQGLKDRGEQGSPWKTTLESGQWAVEGLIEGLISQEGALVSEATSLADQVVDALTLDNISMSPELDARLAPSMESSEFGITNGNGRGVVINQENNVYTELDMSVVNRNLAWDLSTV